MAANPYLSNFRGLLSPLDEEEEDDKPLAASTSSNPYLRNFPAGLLTPPPPAPEKKRPQPGPIAGGLPTEDLPPEEGSIVGDTLRGAVDTIRELPAAASEHVRRVAAEAKASPTPAMPTPEEAERGRRLLTGAGISLGRGVVGAAESGLGTAEAALTPTKGERYGVAAAVKDTGPYKALMRRISQAKQKLADTGGVLEMAREANDPEAAQRGFFENLRRDPLATLTNAGAEQLPQLLTTIGAAAVGGAPAAIGAGFAQEAGSAYNDAKRSGANEEQAQAAAGIYGVGAAIAESVFPVNLVKSAGVPSVERRSIMRRVINGALQEGGTEALQELWGQLSALGVYAGDQGLTWKDLQSAFTPENLARYGAAGVVGGLLGGGLGGASGVTDRRSSPRSESGPENVTSPRVQPQEVPRGEEAQAAAPVPPVAAPAPPAPPQGPAAGPGGAQEPRAAPPSPTPPPQAPATLPGQPPGGRAPSELSDEELAGELRAVNQRPGTMGGEYKRALMAEDVRRRGKPAGEPVAPKQGTSPEARALDAAEAAGDQAKVRELERGAFEAARGTVHGPPQPVEVVADTPLTRESEDDSFLPEVVSVAPTEVDLEPKRFQYKSYTNEATGTAGALRGVRAWDPKLAGVISLWRDPGDGRLKVVNGHHRVAKARELGVPLMRAQVLDARTAEEARAQGALINISEGRGTPVDAAKFFRDTGITREGLRERGIDITDAVARQGVALSRLHDLVFNAVANEQMGVERAVLIAEALPTDQGAQLEVARQVERWEDAGKTVTDRMVRELAEMAASGPRGARDDRQGSLFGGGGEEQSLLYEKAQILAEVRQRLTREKGLFGRMAAATKGSEKAVEELEQRAGNVINRARNEQISVEAAQALEVYDRFRTQQPIAGMLDEAARRLARGEARTKVVDDAYDAIRGAVSQVVGGGDRSSGEGAAPRAEDGEPAAGEPGPDVDPDDRPATAEELEAQGQQGLFGAPPPKPPGGTSKAYVASERPQVRLENEKRPGDKGGDKAPSARAKRPEAVPAKAPDGRVLRAVGMPELVEVAQMLGKGRLPRVREVLRAARGAALGAFYPAKGDARIELRADLAKDPQLAHEVLAHEIGHWIDFVPDATMQRGNLLGRIASLKGHLRSTIDALPTSPSRALTKADRKLFRKQARAAAKSELGKDADKDEVAALAKEVYAELVADAIAERNLITAAQVRDELVALSETWRGKIPEGGPFREYRMRGEELYADALSVLLNNPAMLMDEAPTFWSAFLAYLNRKPEVAEAYFRIQEELDRGGDDRLRTRAERYVSMIHRGGLRRAQALAAGVRELNGQVFAQALVDTLIDQKSPIYRRVKAARKAGKSLSPEANPIYWVEEEAYHSARAAAYLDRFHELVLGPVRAAEIPDRVFGAVLGLRRAATERSELFNPLGEQGRFAQELHDHLLGELGAEKTAILEDAVGRWWELRRQVVEEVADSGAFSEPLVKRMRDNPNYARFVIQQAIRDEGGQGNALGAVKKQIGTLQEIGNPLVETALADVALMRLAHRTSTAKNVVQFMRETHPKEIQDAKRGPQGRLLDARERGMGTLRYLDNGKVKAVYMPQGVVDSVDDHREWGPAYSAWLRFVHAPLRNVLVERNPGWWIWNFARDVEAFATNVVKGDPLTAAVKTAIHVAKAAPEAFRDAVLGQSTPTVNKMLEGRMLVVAGGRARQASELTDEAALNMLLERFSVFAPAEEKGPRVRRALAAVWDALAKPGAFTERVTKIAGYQYLKAHQAELGLSDKEIAHIVRTRVGTPDVMRRGSAFRLYNSVFLFSNVNKEGWRASAESFKQDPWNYALKKLTYNVVLPKLALLLAAWGFFGDELEELLAAVPENDKRNYLIIPWGMVDGKAIYSRVPYDHVGQTVSSLVWTLWNSEEKLPDLVQWAEENFPWSPAALHPYLEAGWATATYASGRNPYDHFFGRPVIPDRTFRAGKYSKKSLDYFGRWLWNQVGGRAVWQPQTESIEGEMGRWERNLELPGIGPVLGRLYKVSDYGLQEDLRRAADEARSEEDRRSILREQLIVEALQAKPDAAPRDVHSALEAAGVGYEKYGTFLRRWRQIHERMSSDPVSRAKSYAGSRAQREAITEAAGELGLEDEEE